MGVKDNLANKAKNHSPVISSEQSPTVGLQSGFNAIDLLKRLDGLIQQRKSNTIAIVEVLKKLHENQDLLKEQTNKTFKDVISEYAELSKSQFYSLIANYDFLEKQDKLELLEKTDTKVIEYIKQQPETEQAELLKQAENGLLTRTKINQTKQSPTVGLQSTPPASNQNEAMQIGRALTCIDFALNLCQGKATKETLESVQTQLEKARQYLT